MEGIKIFLQPARRMSKSKCWSVPNRFKGAKTVFWKNEAFFIFQKKFEKFAENFYISWKIGFLDKKKSGQFWPSSQNHVFSYCCSKKILFFFLFLVFTKIKFSYKFNLGMKTKSACFLNFLTKIALKPQIIGKMTI